MTRWRHFYGLSRLCLDPMSGTSPSFDNRKKFLVGSLYSGISGDFSQGNGLSNPLRYGTSKGVDYTYHFRVVLEGNGTSSHPGMEPTKRRSRKGFEGRNREFLVLRLIYVQTLNKTRLQKERSTWGSRCSRSRRRLEKRCPKGRKTCREPRTAPG